MKLNILIFPALFLIFLGSFCFSQSIVTTDEEQVNPESIQINQDRIIHKDVESVLEPIVLGEFKSRQDSTRIVTGSVHDEEGNALPGAQIIIRGTIFGTVSDYEGKFSLEIPINALTLEVTYIGYNTMEIPLGNQSSLDIVIDLTARYWCCTNHLPPNGPHCANSKEKLTNKYGCTKFKISY